MGHSVGGHGALTIALKNDKKFLSVSALAPVSHPTKSLFGMKQFEAYLGSVEEGRKHDATELISGFTGRNFPLLVSVGTSDKQAPHLMIDDFLEAADKNGFKLIYKEEVNYDHGYYFVSSVIREHIKFHAKYLNAHIDFLPTL
jgi:S-formylglutathione hydrolase FrmB